MMYWLIAVTVFFVVLGAFEEDDEHDFLTQIGAAILAGLMWPMVVGLYIGRRIRDEEKTEV